MKVLCPIFVLMTEEADDRLRPGLEIIDACGGIISRKVGNARLCSLPKSHGAKLKTDLKKRKSKPCKTDETSNGS